MKNSLKNPHEHTACNRRTVLKTAFSIVISGASGGCSLNVPTIAQTAALTKKERDHMTPEQIIAGMQAGNLRFRSGKMLQYDYLAQKRATASGQYPSAVILSCIDSRAPAEIILDAGIGETFNARVAGNIANDDLVGSMEFSCKIAGAKVIMVMGHTACGAIKGAIDNVKLGNLTGLLAKIKPAVDATHYNGERTSKNSDFVDTVAKTNVLHTINRVRQQSVILNSLEQQGKIKIVGAMYHLNGGILEVIT